MQAKEKRDCKMQKHADEHQKLSKVRLIASVRKFDMVISDNQQTSIANKRAKILKEQIRVRDKLLRQRCNIKFSKDHKQHPLTELVKEDCSFTSKYDDATECVQTDVPMLLVGKKV